MDRRKGCGWVNGPRSWEGGERGESQAGLVLEGAESRLCVHSPPPEIYVISVLGFRVFPEDSFALVWMGRTTLASLTPCQMGSFLPYREKDFGMRLLLPPRSGCPGLVSVPWHMCCPSLSL